MKNLLYKEFKLVAHPTTYMFLLLSAMLLIPNYPYYVAFFYTTLGLFFSFLSSRENHDIFYTLTLPISKKDAVSARFIFVVIIELLQFLFGIPFAILRQKMTLPMNTVGMDANIALFGLSFIMIGVFNYYFLTSYYKNPQKVGKSYGVSCIIIFLIMGIFETLDHTVPFFMDKLDTFDNVYIKEKLIVLALGIAIFSLLTFLAYKKSVKSFEKLDF